MIESKLETCPDALSTLIFFNGWLGFESLETDDDSPSKDELTVAQPSLDSYFTQPHHLKADMRHEA